VPVDQPGGYLAAPASGDGPAVLVLHAWWGLNDAAKGFCDRLAESGFVAFAPDLYHGKVADTVAGAEALSSALDADRAMAEVTAAARFLTDRAAGSPRPIAVVGFSLGAYFALQLSDAEPGLVHAAVVFYGTGHTEFGRSKAAYLGHFAENDPFEPKASVDALENLLRSAGRPVEFHRYPGTGHWFFEPDRADAFDATAAGLAWDRTLSFLKPPAAS